MFSVGRAILLLLKPRLIGDVVVYIKMYTFTLTLKQEPPDGRDGECEEKSEQWNSIASANRSRSTRDQKPIDQIDRAFWARIDRLERFQEKRNPLSG